MLVTDRMIIRPLAAENQRLDVDRSQFARRFISLNNRPTHLTRTMSPATVTFAEWQGKTKLTVDVRAFALDSTAVPMIGGMDQGWVQTLERLEELLATLAET